MTSLLHASKSENLHLEFKSAQALKNREEKRQLSDTVAAFSNSDGGFLVIGVSDKAPRSVAGIPDSGEFPKWIRDKIKVHPEPQLDDPRAIEIEPGVFVGVVFVRASTMGPHAAHSTMPPRFMRRTHSGNEPMDWLQIRDAMAAQVSIRRNVELLLSGLEALFEQAVLMRSETSNHTSLPPVRTLDIESIQSPWNELFLQVSADRNAVSEYRRLKNQTSFINGLVNAAVAHSSVSPATMVQLTTRIHHELEHLRDPIVQLDRSIHHLFKIPRPVRKLVDNRFNV